MKTGPIAEGAELLMAMFGPLKGYSEDGERIVMTWQDPQQIRDAQSRASAA